MAARPTGLQLAAYGALGLPLAMAALPIYVHVPKFYADTLGLLEPFTTHERIGRHALDRDVRRARQLLERARALILAAAREQYPPHARGVVHQQRAHGVQTVDALATAHPRVPGRPCPPPAARR